MAKPAVMRFPGPREMALGAARLVVEKVKAAAGKDIFTVCLSGGSTPRPLYENLGRDPFVREIDWDRVHLFWGDERLVSRDSRQSNFRLAEDALLKKIPIPPANLHPMPVEVDPPEDAARAYEMEIARVFGVAPPVYPRFDLVLLGVGADGHTASLFPGGQALGEEKRWVVHVEGAEASPPVGRLTLTLSVINSAKCVVFLASGSGKSDVIEAILSEPDKARKLYPAARVSPRGELFWLVDESSVHLSG